MILFGYKKKHILFAFVISFLHFLTSNFHNHRYKLNNINEVQTMTKSKYSGTFIKRFITLPLPHPLYNLANEYRVIISSQIRAKAEVKCKCTTTSNETKRESCAI